ncbi:MAG: hydroxymethylpyrimidine/phosphomethylpyrimidine kinase [Bacteroidetes bacterium]|nr:hydroxymethylpyrimidine/phosphomethylpyrimidine kinase [Bacteroidota bacterium]
MADRTYVCSIAGFDPSAGAGVGADLKTFEMHGVYGFGILSALTWQNDEKVERVQWLPSTDMLDQLALLVPKFSIDFFKIGIIQNLESLLQLCRYIKQVNPRATIIWDPVVRASADYPFFQGTVDWQQMKGLVDWITPNLPEFTQLIGHDDDARQLSQQFTILKKGGHAAVHQGQDLLFYRGNSYVLEPDAASGLPSPKHGSGCVLSAALCANLAKGLTATEACRQSKCYIEKFLASHHSLLGVHNS